MGTLSLGDGTLDSGMVNFMIMISTLPFGFEVYV
jgi:hypothetical protein